jgi:ribonuclease D
MKEDDSFWETRPLDPGMIDYATQDVIYLPQVYQKMLANYLHINLMHQFYQHG